MLIIVIRRRRKKEKRMKESDKILKYKEVTMETQCMWSIKTKVMSVIIGAAGTVSDSFREYLINMPGKHEIKELQKTAILRTAHVLRKVLIWKRKTFNMGRTLPAVLP
jgi:hypothetical protein